MYVIVKRLVLTNCLCSSCFLSYCLYSEIFSNERSNFSVSCFLIVLDTEVGRDNKSAANNLTVGSTAHQASWQSSLA